jgi:hypothetical protein
MWPQNNSHIRASDEIKLKLFGAAFELSYSWNLGGWYSISEPWNIQIPNQPGLHQLDVEVLNFTGGKTSATYWFTVEEVVNQLEGYELLNNPSIDGLVDVQETSEAERNHITFLQEDGTVSPADLYVGFQNNSVYFGLETQILDSQYTSIELYFDTNGDGSWSTNAQSVQQDFVVCLSAPSTPNDLSGIWSAEGVELEETTSNVSYAISTKNSYLTCEFNLNIDSFSFMNSVSSNIAIRIIQGGILAEFPNFQQNGDILDFAIVTHLGQRPIVQDFSGLFLVSGFALFGAAAFVFWRSRITSSDPNQILGEERLERVRVLVTSYPRSTIEDLRDMSGLSTEDFDYALANLIDSEIITAEITEDGEIIR